MRYLIGSLALLERGRKQERAQGQNTLLSEQRGAREER